MVDTNHARRTQPRGLRRRLRVVEWEEIYREADWDAPGRLNVGHETCDRHADDRGKVALYHVGTDGEATTTTFWELSRESNRVANLLDGLVDRGSRVFSYMPRVPEHYAAMLGTLKAGRVWGSVNERFGPDGIAYRLDDCDAEVVFTTAGNRETVGEALEDAPSVEHVVVLSDDGTGVRRGDLSGSSTVELLVHTPRTHLSYAGQFS